MSFVYGARSALPQLPFEAIVADLVSRGYFARRSQIGLPATSVACHDHHRYC